MDNGATARKAGPATGSFALGLLAGAVIVGVVTLMYAPRAGKETRDMWQSEIGQTQQMFQKWMRELNERIEKFSQLIKLTTTREVPIVKDYQRTAE